MNKVKIFLIPSLLLTTLTALPLINRAVRGASAEEGNVYHVDFFNNFLRQDATLSNGTIFKGNNLLFKTVDVAPNSLVTPPENPTRRNYEFQGWYLDESGKTAWDFESDVVTSNLRLFAKWGLSDSSDLVEPSYTPPSTVLEDGALTDYVVESVMNFKTSFGQVRVPTSAITKLNGSMSDVLPLLEYKVKAGKSISATYIPVEGPIVNKKVGEITVTCGADIQTIEVLDDSTRYTVTSSSDYETKAKKYEAKALEEDSYHVMLAGSSSIEFWENSKTDLDPIVSYNHGIGGTTIEEWDTKLNQRLVYPYKPKMVVYYVGINNVINSKEDITTITNRIMTLFEDTHNALPNTQIQYILMNQLPNYSSYKSVINSVNGAVITYQATHSDWLTLINPGEALLKENGEPNAAYFRTDGLHLSHYGYSIWGSIIKESIFAGLEAMQ